MTSSNQPQTCHLSFERRGETSRIFLVADDGRDLGYLQQAATGFRDDQWSSTVDSEVLGRLVAAASTVYPSMAHADAAQTFVLLKQLSRGVNWAGPKARALKKAAATFTFTA